MHELITCPVCKITDTVTVDELSLTTPSRMQHAKCMRSESFRTFHHVPLPRNYFIELNDPNADTNTTTGEKVHEPIL